MAINPQVIEEIKNRIDIVDVIGDFVDLKKSGSSYKALSPFTSEKTPSFYVVPAKGIFKCFSSGKGGDAIKFIMEHDGLSYIEAIKYLGKKYGIEIEEEAMSEDQIRQQNEREALFVVLNHANQFYQKNLWETEEGNSVAVSYLSERGYNEETVRKFELGYSLEEWDAYYNHAIDQKYSEEQLEKAGLLLKKNEKSYDRFRGRIMFPIHNLTGKVIAFGARTLSSDKKLPKYVNSPETEVYHKGSVLYGLHLAKRSIREQENCFLVEGYTDVMSLHQMGIENVVSSSGTALTEDQIKLIKRYTDHVTVLFDGDEAGIRASIRGIDMLLEGDLNVKVVVFPDNEDPDSYAKKVGVNEFKYFLQDNSKDFIRFKIGLFTRENSDDPIRKAETIREIVGTIAKIPDPVKRTVYIKESSDLLDIDESVLITEQNKVLIKSRKKEVRKYDPSADDYLAEKLKQEQEVSADPQEIQERECIRLLINYGTNKLEEEYNVYDYLISELEDIEFFSPVYREILKLFKKQLREGKVADASYFIENGTEEIKEAVIDLVTDKYEVSDNWHAHHIYVPKESELLENLVYTNILRLKYRIIGRLIKQNLEQLDQLEDSGMQKKLLKIHQELKNSEIEIGNKLGIVVN